MNYHEAAYCGDFCGGCENYHKSCSGCDPKYKCGPEHQPECPFIACCRKHEVAHCGLCRDFPCALLAAFVPDDRPGRPAGYHIQNLRNRAIVGTEDWLIVQRARCGLPTEKSKAVEPETSGE